MANGFEEEERQGTTSKDGKRRKVEERVGNTNKVVIRRRGRKGVDVIDDDIVPEKEFVDIMRANYQAANGLDFNLPPMHDLEEIFLDMAKNAVKLGIGTFVKHLRGRKLRVVTMCSGTESPLLALQMLCEGQ